MSLTLIELVKQADCARRENRLADAHRDLVEAVALCRQASAHYDLAGVLTQLGLFEQCLGRADAARPLYEEAVAIFRDEGHPLILAQTVRDLGDIHNAAGRVEQAESCYYEALVLYRSREQTSPLDLAWAIRPLAVLKDAAGEVEEARRLREELARRIARWEIDGE